MAGLIALALLACSASDGDPAGEDGLAGEDLSALVEEVRAEAQSVGLSGLVADSTEVLGWGVAGERVIGDGDPIAPLDAFHLGSCGKAVTATLAGMADHEGLLGFDETVGAVWPDLEIDEAFADVTIADLLSHRSGLSGEGQEHIDWWIPLYDDEDIHAARLGFTAKALGGPPDNPVGGFEYSNAGFIVAGAALETRLGGTWEELVTERILEPLAMDRCGFGPPARPDPEAAPWGHWRASGALGPVDPALALADNPAGFGPAGTLHCPPSQWARFGQWHLRAARGDREGLPELDWDRLHTAVPDDGEGYGLGWRVDGATFNHRGTNLQFMAQIWIDPDADLVVLSATNEGDGPAAQVLVDLEARLLDFAEGRP
jgi:D-alanyl-D-alanine carboxypeptidase